MPIAPASADLIMASPSWRLRSHSTSTPASSVQIDAALKPDGTVCATPRRHLGELRKACSAAESELTGGAKHASNPFADIRDYCAMLPAGRRSHACRLTDIAMNIRGQICRTCSLLKDLRREWA